MEEAVVSEVASQVLTRSGHERLTKKSETKTLRLAAGESIKLIFGRNHIVGLRRGNDYSVRISIDGFQLPDPETDALIDEVKLPANASVEIRRDSTLADNKIDLKKTGNHDEFLGKQVVDYHINFPNRAVNLQDQNIDFTDIEGGLSSGLSILIGVAGRRAEDNMVFITNHDGEFGVAVITP